MDLRIKAETEVDKLVERELTEFWLQPGERLLLGCPPIRGHVGVRLGAERRLPHVPLGDVPRTGLGPSRWPLPANGVHDEDWADDPTVAYWVNAQRPGQFAVRLADHFAASLGEARLVPSSAHRRG
jgi:hypothetical protein